jgi:hypothetical protein
MKQTKFRYFRATLIDGLELDFKTPSPVTEGYAFMNCAHLLSKQYKTRISTNEVKTIKGIK